MIFRLFISTLLVIGISFSSAVHLQALLNCGFSINDGSINSLIFKGLEQSRIRHNITYQINGCYNAEKTQLSIDVNNTEHIFMASSSLTDEDLRTLLTNNPTVKFTTVDFLQTIDYENIQAALFLEHDVAYLAGALAGKVTKTKTVGGIFGIPFTSLIRFHNGYVNGVRQVCPDCTIETLFAYTFNVADLGEQLVSDLLNRNADVIFTAAGHTGSGGLFRATTSNVFAIGVDTDQFFTQYGGWNDTTNQFPVRDDAKYLISSAEKRVQTVVEQVVTDHMNGKFNGGSAYSFGLHNNAIEMSACHASCSLIDTSIFDFIDTLSVAVRSGSISTNVEASNGYQNSFKGKIIPANSWTNFDSFAVPPIARFRASGVLITHPLGHHMYYMFGGFSENFATLKDTWQFIYENQQWTELSTENVLVGHNGNETFLGERFPEARHSSTMAKLVNVPSAYTGATYGDQVVMFGGTSEANTLLNDLWILSPPQFAIPREIWTEMDQIVKPAARNGHTICDSSNDGEILMFGGEDSEKKLNDMWKLNVADVNSKTATWTIVCEFCAPAKRKLHAMKRLGNIVYIFGGESETFQPLSDLWSFNTITLEWKHLRDAPQAYKGHTMEIVIGTPNGEEEAVLIVYGGEGHITTNPFMYSPSTDEWHEVKQRFSDENNDCASNSGDADQAYYRKYHNSYAVGDKLVVLGGSHVDKLEVVLKQQVLHLATIELPFCDLIPGSYYWQFSREPCDLGTMTTPIVYSWVDPSKTCSREKNDEGKHVVEAPLPVLAPEFYPRCDFTAYTSTIGVVVVIFSVLGILVCGALMTITFLVRKHKVMKRSQPGLTLLMGAGTVLLNVSSILSLGDHTMVACQLRIWLFNIAFDVTFASLWAKIYRIHTIFNNKLIKKVVLKDSDMNKLVASIVLIDVAVLLIWTIMDPSQPTVTPMPLIAEMEKGFGELQYITCESSNPSFVAMTAFYKVILVFTALVMVYRSRNLTGDFLDQKYIVMSAYNIGILGGLTFLVGSVFDLKREAVLSMQAICICFTSCVALSVEVLPKYLVLIGVNKVQFSSSAAPRTSSMGMKCKPGTSTTNTVSHG